MHCLPQVLLAKASRHLASKEVDAAAAVYKGFERRGTASMPAAAATNLSFLYLLEGDLTAAAHYTDLALKADRCDNPDCRVGIWPSPSSPTYPPLLLPLVGHGNSHCWLPLRCGGRNSSPCKNKQNCSGCMCNACKPHTHMCTLFSDLIE